MKSKTDWIKLLWLFVSNLVKQPLLGAWQDCLGNRDKAEWHYKECLESYYWIKIHVGYKSKRIK